jgi:hypothetical protein
MDHDPSNRDVLQTPFDTVENAQQYVKLLVETIAEARGEVAADLSLANRAKSDRRVQALQLVHFKLDKLEQHLKTSSRLLNDLRTLRRLLFEERSEGQAVLGRTEDQAVAVPKTAGRGSAA